MSMGFGPFLQKKVVAPLPRQAIAAIWHKCYNTHRRVVEGFCSASRGWPCFSRGAGIKTLMTKCTAKPQGIAKCPRKPEGLARFSPVGGCTLLPAIFFALVVGDRLPDRVGRHAPPVTLRHGAQRLDGVRVKPDHAARLARRPPARRKPLARGGGMAAL